MGFAKLSYLYIYIYVCILTRRTRCPHFSDLLLSFSSSLSLPLPHHYLASPSHPYCHLPSERSHLPRSWRLMKSIITCRHSPRAPHLTPTPQVASLVSPTPNASISCQFRLVSRAPSLAYNLAIEEGLRDSSYPYMRPSPLQQGSPASKTSL